ncbi:MAG TPA: DUF4760 domain-containing protein [Gaiellaceae bacterium]|nr:DUF4760 domain-containing protein [Gaiellaceae bacterium]
MAVVAMAPNWAAQLAAIGTLVTAAAAVAGAIAAYLALGQLEETRRDRHVQVIADLGRRWDDAQLAAARKKQLAYASVPLSAKVEQWLRHPDTDSEAMLLLLRVPNFFEDLAVMVESGSLDLRLVSKAFKSPALRQWQYWEPSIRVIRDHEDPDSYAQFENLVRQLEKLDPG